MLAERVQTQKEFDINFSRQDSLLESRPGTMEAFLGDHNEAKTLEHEAAKIEIGK